MIKAKLKYVFSGLVFLSFLSIGFVLNKPAQLPEPQFYGLYAPLNELKDYVNDLKSLGIHWFRVGGINNDGCLLAAKNDFHLVPILSVSRISLNNTVPADQFNELIEAWRIQVRKTVGRYGPNGTLWKENPQINPLPVRYWEIWNEPNIEFLNPPQGMTRAQVYAILLESASEEIRNLDPGAKIIAFNVAGGASEGKPSPDVYVEQFQYFGWRRFIRETVQLTGVNCFDCVGLHPYTQPLGSEAGGVIKGLELLRELSSEQKFADKKIWFTEVGYPIEYPRNKQVRDELQQACFTIRLYAIAAAHGVTQLQNMYMKDIIYRQDNTRRSFGFFTAPGLWREQAKALQVMIRLLPDPRGKSTILQEKAEGVFAYFFKGAGKWPVLMAWNAGEGEVKSEFRMKAKEVILVNMTATEIRKLEATKGKVSISLNEAPVYLISAPLKEVEELLK